MKTTSNTESRKVDSKARNILWCLVFTGFAVNYMLRINLNIAIVSMVKSRPNLNNLSNGECGIINSTHWQQTLSNINTTINLNNNSIQESKTVEDSDDVLMFSWNEKQQSNILGAYFWVHWVTQIPGGVLATKYGTKFVFGFSNFCGMLCCMCIPFAASLGYNYLIAIRALQGLIMGVAWPSMHNMAARWIPPNERSRFVASYLGSSIGAALTYPLCGFIIDTWNWQAVFYVCTAIGIVWYIFWLFFVYDNPTKHPTISTNEKKYIIDSLQGTYNQEKCAIPWRQILTSVPVLMNILAQGGAIWGLFTLITFSPTYLKFIHGWNNTATGIISGLPHVLRTLWSCIFSHFADYLLTSKRLQRTNIRKLATLFCTVVQGICTLILSFANCDTTMAIIFITLSIAINGSVSTGPLASLVDISPNYASVLMGIQNTTVGFVGFLTAIVVGVYTNENQTIGQWQKVFWISSAIQIVPGIFYLLFSNSTLQAWNSSQGNNTNSVNDTELMIQAQKQKSEVKAQQQL